MKKSATQSFLRQGRYMSFAKFLLVGIFLISQLGAIAQQKSLTGKVTGEDGNPVPGVTVVVKGTTTGTVTDIDGNYTLPNVSENATVAFSFVGMKTQEFVVGDQSAINVTMATDAIGLDEVIAIGYGTARKQDLTGSVVNVKAEELMKYQPASVSDLLRTSVPGLKVGYSTDARATPDFEIRGDNTIKSDDAAEVTANRPLIVVDGVIFNGDLSEINVNDVESIDVLKDASAASIYGSRASNGVVVFTTKRGATSKPTFRFNTSFGLVTGARRIASHDGVEVMEWLQKMNESINNKLTAEWSRWTPYDKVPDQFKNDWLTENNIPGETDMQKITSVWLDNFGFEQNEKENYFAGKSYDWQDWLFRTGKRQDYNFSVSGRGSRVTYYWSLGYRENESVQFGESFTTINSRLNFDVAVTDWLNLGLNTHFAYENDGQQPVEHGGYYTASPYDMPWENDMPQIRENLKRAGAGSNRGNPFLDPAFINRVFDRYRFFPTMYGKLTLPYGFEFTSRFTQRLDFRRRFQFNDPAHPIWTHGGEARRRHNQNYEWQTDNILNWSREFGQHNFDVTGLWNAERNQQWETNAFTRQFSPNAVLGFHEMAYGLQPSVDSYDEANTRTAIMGRVNYSYAFKYYLSASIRRDGYSRFGKNHLYATFPSVSAGWTITREEFMAGRANWLSFLKLRLTWGVNGNSSGIGDYAAYARLNDNKYLNYNNGYYLLPYLYVDRMENSDLAWEKNQAWNLGLDYGILDGRIRGALDIYTSKTTDLLLDKKLPIVTGFYSVTTNVGSLQNTGFDLSINTVNIENSNLKWTSSLNMHYNKNKIVSLTGEKIQRTDSEGNPMFDNSGNPIMYEPDDYDNGWFIGKDKDVIWDYEIDGIYQIGEEEEAAKYGLYPGDFRVIDQNGDGRLNNDDKVFLGTRSNPWYVTFTNEVNYKGFDLGVVFLGKLGYQAGNDWRFNNRQEYIKNHNWYKLPYWTPQNQHNEYARINSIRLAGMNVYVPKSYVRFQHLSFGYTFQNNLLESIKFNRARVGFNIENVALFTKWDFGDPESDKEMPRIFSFSLDFSF